MGLEEDPSVELNRSANGGGCVNSTHVDRRVLVAMGAVGVLVLGLNILGAVGEGARSAVHHVLHPLSHQKRQ